MRDEIPAAVAKAIQRDWVSASGHAERHSDVIERARVEINESVAKRAHWDGIVAELAAFMAENEIPVPATKENAK